MQVRGEFVFEKFVSLQLFGYLLRGKRIRCEEVVSWSKSVSMKSCERS